VFSILSAHGRRGHVSSVQFSSTGAMWTRRYKLRSYINIFITIVFVHLAMLSVFGQYSNGKLLPCSSLRDRSCVLILLKTWRYISRLLTYLLTRNLLKRKRKFVLSEDYVAKKCHYNSYRLSTFRQLTISVVDCCCTIDNSTDPQKIEPVKYKLHYTVISPNPRIFCDEFSIF